MQYAATSLCCEAPYVTEGGFTCCTGCGAVARRELDENKISFLQNVSYLNNPLYTRAGRFSKKIVAALLQKTSYTPPEHIVLYLNDAHRRGVLVQPEDIITAIAKYKTTARRPYIYATCLWNAMAYTAPIPEISDVNERFIKILFEEIFFSWTRLDIARPRLPMSQAIVLIVENFQLGDEATYLIRFIRKLKCQRRRARYFFYFRKCLRYISNDAKRSERLERFEPWRHFVQTDNYSELFDAAQDFDVVYANADKKPCVFQ
jgi:hypothetical protein